MMRMLENVPHVSATFNGHSALFLLDTGAGGVDVIFHGRAVEEFDLMSTVEPVGSARVKGISSSSGGIQVPSNLSPNPHASLFATLKDRTSY
jgi:hypothetical protein